MKVPPAETKYMDWPGHPGKVNRWWYFDGLRWCLNIDDWFHSRLTVYYSPPGRGHFDFKAWWDSDELKALVRHCDDVSVVIDWLCENAATSEQVGLARRLEGDFA